MEGGLVPSGTGSLHRHGYPVVADSMSRYPQPGSMAGTDPRAANEDRSFFDALIERSGFDPAGFDYAVHPIRESADLGSMELMVTVTCRAARISRTYLSRGQHAAWLVDLSDDLRAGVYGS